MMHQWINSDPVNDCGTYRFLNGRTTLYAICVLRAWEKAGIVRQVSFDTWEQVEPSPEFQRDVMLQNILVRVANNTAQEITSKAEFILRNHPLVVSRLIFEICMDVCKREYKLLKQTLGNIPIITDQCDA